MVSPSATLMTLPVSAKDIIGQRSRQVVRSVIFFMTTNLNE